jgi:L-alanine-DL-glutamate epimerase-like enolase superfamily enzyme
MGDMVCHDADAALRELQEGTSGIIALKIFRTGFIESKRIVKLAEQFGVPCVIGTAGESMIGTHAAAHLATALRNVRQPAEISNPLMLGDEIVTSDTPPLERAEIKLDPSRPGIGVEIDEAKLSRYADAD